MNACPVCGSLDVTVEVQTFTVLSAGPVVIRHRATGCEYTAWLDPEGIWLEDPAEGSGYIGGALHVATGTAPAGWEWVTF